MDPFFILDTPKSSEEVSAALQEAVVDQDFGVLAVHDLGNTLGRKGLPLPEQCRIFEVCNPQQAAAVLSTTMALTTPAQSTPMAASKAKSGCLET